MAREVYLGYSILYNADLQRNCATSFFLLILWQKLVVVGLHLTDASESCLESSCDNPCFTIPDACHVPQGQHLVVRRSVAESPMLQCLTFYSFQICPSNYLHNKIYKPHKWQALISECTKLTMNAVMKFPIPKSPNSLGTTCPFILSAIRGSDLSSSHDFADIFSVTPAHFT